MVSDRFLIGMELGSGGMATVYAAEDMRLRREVALKMLHPHLRDQPDILSRFRAEARAVASLKHRHVVEVYDVASTDEHEAYIVAERIYGSTLRKVLRALGPLEPEVAAILLLDVLGGLGAAHAAGMVHRDIKPENVMLAGIAEDGKRIDGAPVCVKVMDFGVAKWSGASGMTATGQMLGSPAHMAPEQIEGGQIDARTDVFAAGILFYEMLTGELPFRGASPAQSFHRILSGVYDPADVVRPLVGRRWAHIVARALARDPSDRYENAEQFAAEVRAECIRLQAMEDGALEAYFLAPEQYQSENRAKLVTRLCELGAAAHARGDILGASDDLNRAAALDPSNVKALSLLARLARTRRNAGMLRMASQGAAAALLLSAAGFGAWRLMRPAPLAATPTRDALVTENAGALEGAPRATPPTSSSPPGVAAQPPPMASNKPGQRKVRMAELVPNAGVFLSVDGAPAAALRAGESVPLSEAPHELVFSCAQDLCIPHTRKIPAGSSDTSLEIKLQVRPASLTVEGDLNHTYGILERPTLLLRAGAPLSIPMEQGVAALTVVQDVTGERRDVVVRAGKASVVRF